MSTNLFDTTACEFSASTDKLIADNNYVRGRLFVEALQNYVSPGGKVLDFGCGPGRISVLAAKQGFEVVGVDSSASMIRAASGQSLDGLKVSFAQCEGNGDDLGLRAYDAIICSSVIEYVFDPQRLLANFVRALQPGGTLILTFANRRSLWLALVRLFQADRPHNALQKNLWSYYQASSYLTYNGFVIKGEPIFFEASTFDKRRLLRSVSKLSTVGSLCLIVGQLGSSHTVAL